jgi:hypothetical protein
VSLAEFQRAFADLVASPVLTMEARRDPSVVLRAYELDAREQRRLVAMIHDPAMSVNCTLFRVNRLTPLYSVLPLTCQWLGERLGAELDAFWEASRDATLQFGPEAARFGAWLHDRIRRGRLQGGPLEDAIRFELAAFEVRTASVVEGAACDPHPRKRLVAFQYPPEAVFRLTEAPVGRLAEPEWLLLDATSTELRVQRVVAWASDVEDATRMPPSGAREI